MNTRYHVVAWATLGLVAGFGAFLSLGSKPEGGDALRPRASGVAVMPASPSAADLPAQGVNIALPMEAPVGKLDPGLRALAAHTPQSLAAASGSMNLLPEFVTDPTGTELMVEFLGRDAAATAAAIKELAVHGLHTTVRNGRLAAGWMPITSLSALESNRNLLSARALPKLNANLGQVDNQGDVAMLSNLVRERYAVDGKGVKVGILSTSFDLAGGMAATIASGELPGPGNPNGYTQPIRIVAEGLPGVFPAGNLDEGRAMAEVVHDIAPGAELLFAGMQGTSSVHLVEAMERLAQAGADIIVDDIGLAAFTVPFFQDDAAARKVDELTARGVHYFVAAGNHRAPEMYEAQWTSRGFFNVSTFDTFDFDPSDGGFLPVMTLGPSAGAATYSGTFTIQWDEPWASFSAPGVGAANSLRVLVLDPSNRVLFTSASPVGGNPLLNVAVNNANAATLPYVNIAILKPKDGRANPGRIKLLARLTNASLGPRIALRANTVFSHANARSALSIGAASWFNTPQGALLWNRDFANRPATVGTGLIGPATVPETAILSHVGGPSVLFRGLTGANLITGSTVGQQPILFDHDGNRLSSAELRENPSIVAADGIQTTFFGQKVGNISTSPFFFGTSAATPNAGAVAALLLQASRKTLTGAELRSVMTRTAQDMDNPYDGVQTDPADPLFARGYDPVSGYGLVQALPAVEQVIASMGAQKPSLTSQCQTGESRRWRIDNPNGFGLYGNLSANASIRLPGESGFGASSRSQLLIPPGGLTFETLRPPFTWFTSMATLSWQYQGVTVGTANALRSGTWPACP